MGTVAGDARRVRVTHRGSRIARSHAAADGDLIGGARHRGVAAVSERRADNGRASGARLAVNAVAAILASLTGSAILASEPVLAVDAIDTVDAVVALVALSAGVTLDAI